MLKRDDIVSTGSGLDALIEDIRTELAALPWMEKSFGRAFELPNRNTSALDIAPHVYLGNREYFNVMPNDQYKSYSFVIGRGAGTKTDEGAQSYSVQTRYSKQIDIHGYFNLDKIDPAKDYIYTEELVKDMLDSLTRVRGLIVDAYYCETIRDVYAAYTLKEIDRDLLYAPFAGARITATAYYKLETPC